jgi:dihydrolipoamide dehydrogenase
MSKVYDLIIIGSGPAGYVGALRAAQLGGSVAVVEARELGGVCLNRGCIPTKCLVESAAVLLEVQRAQEMGIRLSSPTVDFGQVIARAQGVVDRLRRGIQSLFGAARVELIEGRGRLLSADCVLIESGQAKQELRGRAVLLATGSEPARPGPLALASPRAVTSDDLLRLGELPRRLLVIGAGVTGCEFAGGFRQLGSEVTLVEMLEDILPVVDHDVRRGLLSSFRRNRVQVLTGTRVEKLVDTGSAIVAELSQGGPVEADLALVATGRRFNVEGLGLEEVGVALAGSRIAVDGRGRTSVAGVWAAGDVASSRWLLAHVASRQAVLAVEDIFGASDGGRTDVVPFGIFTLPEVGAVGLTEAEARAGGREVSVGRFPFAALGRAVTAGRTEGFVKVVADSRSGELLGVHILGPRAADLVHEAALALEQGLTVEALIRTIHAHPTFAEALQEAALDSVGRVLHLPKRGD